MRRVGVVAGHVGAGRPALAGVRVVELATVVAAPAAAACLADFGADVVKVEAPAGARTNKKRNITRLIRAVGAGIGLAHKELRVSGRRVPEL